MHFPTILGLSPNSEDALVELWASELVGCCTGIHPGAGLHFTQLWGREGRIPFNRVHPMRVLSVLDCRSLESSESDD